MLKLKSIDCRIERVVISYAACSFMLYMLYVSAAVVEQEVNSIQSDSGIPLCVLYSRCLRLCAASANCDREFSSTIAREGRFSSPGYPSPHPGDITCRYRFHGHGRERVQIIFNDVDLNTPSASMPTKTKWALFFPSFIVYF